MQSEKCKCKVCTGFINQIRLSGGHIRADLFRAKFRAQLHWSIDIFKSILSKNIVYLLKLTLTLVRRHFCRNFLMTLECIPNLSSCGIYSMNYKSKFKIWWNLFMRLSISVLHRITQYCYHFHVFVKRIFSLRWEIDEK